MELKAGLAAIVTGGASGLGEATVRLLSSRGVRCAIFDRDETRGNALAAELGQAFFPCNVSQDASVQEAFDGATARHGPARILVNCAGVGSAEKVAGRNRSSGAITGHAIATFEKVLQINLVGTFRTMVRFAKDLLALDPLDADGERGVIVNTASIAAQDGQVGQAAYSASKAGVIGLALPAARDLAREGIRVVTIAPGFFATRLTGAAPEAMQKALVGTGLFPHRPGQGEEFARLVEHICVNTMLNAETIRLDAGARLPPRSS